MSCVICERISCSVGFHSIDEQSLYEDYINSGYSDKFSFSEYRDILEESER
jgi:hypothetical protein